VLTAKTESLRTVAVGQKAEVTDLHEAGGQDVEQETADKFHCFQSHHFEAFAILGVPPAKADTIFDEADQSAVGDGHTVGVASQIFEHMVGATGRDVHPAYTHALDYELELGWVLSKPLFNATPEEAVRAIGGFVVVNDFSARDVQRTEMRTGLGPQKSKHFLTSMSQTMVTASEVLPYIDELMARVEINGQIVTRTSTHGMGYSLGEVLAHLSLSERLYPGELIASGTLPGGSGMETGHWLRPGDLLRLVIEPIGEIVNEIG